MAESVLDTPDLKDLQEEELWGLINDNRHAICLNIRPCVLIPYLRQARVLTDLDEDEILNCLTLINRSMRTSHMLDLLRIQGCNGAMALLESLMIHYPTLYTQITGRQPSIEPSHFSGLIKYTELTEYLVHAVSSMQTELQVTQHESARLRAQCCELEGKLGQAEQNNQEFIQIQREHARLHNHLDGLNRELLKLKDEKCDLYVRYTTALEEKSANVIRNRDLQLEIYQLQCDLRKAQKQTEFQRQHSVKNLSDTQKLKDELSAVRAKLLETETFSPVKQDILAHDLKEIETRRSELAEEVNRINEENEQLQQKNEELLEEKDSLALEVAKLTVDCEMYKHRSMLFQSQLEDVQAERDKQTSTRMTRLLLQLQADVQRISTRQSISTEAAALTRARRPCSNVAAPPVAENELPSGRSKACSKPELRPRCGNRWDRSIECQPAALHGEAPTIVSAKTA